METDCVHQLFERQAVLTPGDIAVQAGIKSLTYQQLNSRANKLAHFLSDKYFVIPGQPIGLMLKRSESAIIALLAIFKAGGVYVPINPQHPADYIINLCHDSGIKVIITEAGLPYHELTGFQIINVNANEISRFNDLNPQVELSGKSLAYIIFTSGSTGKPKGVMTEHRSLFNKISWRQEHYPLTGSDIVMQKTNFVFDISLWEMLWPITCGAQLYFLTPGAQADPIKIIEEVLAYQVTVIHFVPSLLQLFLRHLEFNPDLIKDLKSLKRVFTSGEALTVTQVESFREVFKNRPDISMSNLYGPTEAAIEVTYYDIDLTRHNEIIPIGKPVKNTEIYIIDENGNKVNDGDSGELIIGGVQVARGYINRPDLTLEKFIDNPFRPGEKMYRSGDKARFLPDGNIIYLGRIDEQIKLNGYRIEPGAIENAITQNKFVRGCIVLAKKIHDVDELVAYLLIDDDIRGYNSLLQEVTETLGTLLPAYMIPGFFVRLKSFPLNSNGKVDRPAFPMPSHRYSLPDANMQVATNDVEFELTQIWKDALNLAAIGIKTNFFEAGGSSLLTAKVIADINSKFKIKLPLSALYQYQTIKEIADLINNQVTDEIGWIILLRPGTGVPVFLFPGWNGSPLSFKPFENQFDNSSPLYCLVYPEDNAGYTFSSLQDYAKTVIAEMTTIQPSGPYNLLGHSMGGRLIFEIALQLQAAKLEVNMLAVISDFIGYPLSSSLKAAKIYDEWQTFKILKPALKFKYLTHRVPNSIKYLCLSMLGKHTDYVIGEEGNYKKMFSLWENYHTDSKFNGDLLLFYEKFVPGNTIQYKRIEGFRRACYPQIWKKAVNGKIFATALYDDHLNLLAEPSINQITRVVTNYLQRKYHSTLVEV